MCGRQASSVTQLLRLSSSDSGVPLAGISRLVRPQQHSRDGLVYRKQIRPVLQGGKTAMDRIFNGEVQGTEPAGAR